jgi:hypothetical protein
MYLFARGAIMLQILINGRAKGMMEVVRGEKKEVCMCSSKHTRTPENSKVRVSRQLCQGSRVLIACFHRP